MPRNPVRNRVVLPALACGPLLALVWWTGPRLGLASVPARLGWTLLLAALWAALAVPAFRARRSRDPGPADPTVPDGGPDRARRAMARAVAALRASHLGRRARYALPWYLVLGAPGAGKTRLLERSGLPFTLPAPDPEPDGDAPGCRWWFATDGVFLEAPGRWAEAGAEDGEWPELLRLLKAYRPRMPVEGVLLVVALEDLAGPGAGARGRLARRRLGQLERRCRRRVPAYLVVTGLDRLRGFGACFAALPEPACAPAWGAALPPDPGPGWDPVRAVAERFEELGRGLAQAGADAAGGLGGAAPALATFPLEFRALGPGLEAFLAGLAGPDPYHPRPFLRGFYFASAQCGPGPELGSGARIAARFALPAPGPAPDPAAPSAGQDRSWFVTGLFRQVLLADRHLARSLGRCRRPGIRRGTLAAALAGLALLAGAWTGSFTGNRRLVRTALADAREARDLAASPDLEDRLRALQVLQVRLDLLDRPRPLALGWGLHQGRRMERRLRAQYYVLLARTLLAPVRDQLETFLAASGRNRPRGPAPDSSVYAALRTYLMLGQRERMEPSWLAPQLLRWWSPWLRARAGGVLAPDLARQAEGTVAFYLARTGDPDLPVLAPRPERVAAARARLGPGGSAVERLYAQLRARAEARFEPLTLARILDRQDPDLAAGAGAVPGCFTRAAWEGHFRDAFQEAARSPDLGADWVLDPPAGPERAQGRLEALYLADYGRAWARFLQGLEVRACPGPPEAAATLGRLAAPQGSALKVVLARAARETDLAPPASLGQTLRSAGSRMLEQAGRLLGAGPGAPEPSAPEIPAAPLALAAVLAAPPASLDGYLERLQKVRARLLALAQADDPAGAARQWLQATHQGVGELAEAQQWLESCWGPGGRDDAAGPVRALLRRPLVQAYGALVADAEQDLERAWAQELVRPWRALADRYPLADSDQDAPAADLLGLFRPGDGLLARFVQTRLAGLVVLQGNRYAARPWAGRGPAFAPAFLDGISRLRAAGAGLGDGGPVRFELRPEPTPGLCEITLEIDGQRLHYRNGPQAWTGFAWPGPGPEAGARIHAVTLQGAGAEVLAAPGPLGLLRLLARARADRPGAPELRLEWPVPALPGSCGVRFAYRRVSGPDPMRLADLRGLSLPTRVCR